ncbi:unnamed protein product, partial [Hymenolepis diminuta]
TFNFHCASKPNSDDTDSVILIEPTDCLSPYRLHPLATLVDGGSQSRRIKITPGRRAYRILSETPIAMSLTIFIEHTTCDQAEIMIGPMESCLKKCIKEPSKTSKSGEVLIKHICEILKSYVKSLESDNNSESTVGNAKNAFGKFVDDLFLLESHFSAEKISRMHNNGTGKLYSKEPRKIVHIP